MTDKQKSSRRRPCILLGVTGSVAAVKGPELALRLSRDLKLDVRVLLTQGGQNFWLKSSNYNPQHWEELQRCLAMGQQSSNECADATTDALNKTEKCGTIQLHDANEEWKDWNQLGDPVLHTDLRDWADIFVIAPLSAHTLAKISQGFCDDTLSCVVRAWDFGHGIRPGKPILLAPAMNTAMWQHPLTQLQLKTVQGFWNHSHSNLLRETTAVKDNNSQINISGVKIIAPQTKALACGEVGDGALATVDDILNAVQETIFEFSIPT